MSNRRRIHRQPCNLAGRIFVPGSKTVIPCTITDISTHGSFITTPEHESVPPNFDLTIGMSILPRACRIARREANGFGIEFLEPVRHEVEEILTEHAFKEELMFEALNPVSDGAETITGVRLRQTVNAIMDLIERRNAMVWQHTATHETPTGNVRASATPMPVRYSHTPLKELLRSA